jgi:hypothetical protein
MARGNARDRRQLERFAVAAPIGKKENKTNDCGLEGIVYRRFGRALKIGEISR